MSARTSRIGAVRLTATSGSTSLGGISTNVPACPMPAFATRMSTRPATASAASASRSASPGQDKSATSTVPPMRSASSSSAFLSRPCTNTWAPAVASASAVARPIPLEAPVTSATDPRMDTCPLSTSRPLSRTRCAVCHAMTRVFEGEVEHPRPWSTTEWAAGSPRRRCMVTTTTATGQPSATAGRNVLDELDKRVPTSFIWSLTLLATLGGFLFGYDTSNIGSALPFIPYHLNGFWNGYLVAGASLGAAAGALLAGPLTDKFGRKSLLIADAAIYALGALLSSVTPNAAVLLVARTFIGLAIGADSAIATAYIAEYAPAKRRGSLGMLQQWMITVGILVAYLVAL